MTVKRISDVLYEATDLLAAIQFIRTFTTEQQDQAFDIVKIGELFFIQQHSETISNENEKNIATYLNGKLTKINFTEILSGLNSDLMKIDSSLRNYVIQVIERGE